MIKRSGFLLASIFMIGLVSCREHKFDSSSMEPTIKQGEGITVNYTAYVEHSPERWDIVAYENEGSGGRLWCQRVVGLPGESIDIQDSAIVINGQKQPFPSKIATIRYIAMMSGPPAKVYFPFKIPNDSYFVLGDNTNDCWDSRYIGPVKKDDIKGRVEGK